MKHLFLPIAVALTAASTIPAAAQTRTMNLQGTTYTVDTVEHYVAGPATKYSRLAVRSASNTFAASVLEIDMKAENRPQIKVEVGRDSVRTAESVSSMAKRKSGKDKRYIAGINGDFFITSAFAGAHPLGNQILGYPNVTSATEGKLISPDEIDQVSREKCFMMTTDGYMYIDATDLTGTFSFPGKKSDMKLYKTNYPRTDSEIVFYNSYYGGWTKTDDTGWEVTLKLAEGETWGLNRPVKMVVVSEPRQGGNSRIPADGAVISAGSKRTSQIEYIKKYEVGMEVNINLNVSLPKHDGIKPDISEIIGGDVRILNQGNVTKAGDPDAIRFINSATARYIRSLIGYSKERDKLVLCAVDAGIGGGGVTYYDAGDLMRELGCYDALDFDGGGSTAMYLRTPGIVNHLRDGSERAVGNAIYAVVNAPEDNTVRSIRFADHALKLPQFSSYTPVIYGYNKNGELISMDVKGVKLSVPAEYGEIRNDGTLFITAPGCFPLTATYNGATATVAVTADLAGDLKPKYESVLMDNLRSWDIELVTTVKGELYPLHPAALTWSSSNPAIAEVTSEGTVKGLKDGTVTLRGTLDKINVELPLTVECPVAKESPFASLTGTPYTLAATGVSANLSPLANGSEISYTVTNTRTCNITLTPVSNTALFSLPDAFSINVKGNLGYKLLFTFVAHNGETATYTADNLAANEDNVVKIPFNTLFNTADMAATYPLTLTKIIVYPKSSKTSTPYTCALTSPTLYYDSYSGVEGVTADGEDMNAPVEFYDISGRKVLNPVPGNFYIRRQGNSVSKIIL